MTKNVSINADDSLSQEALYGPNVSFAVSEAYKLLRTNVMYSFASESRCHIVGVVSSVRGEGKSTTACNLAYTLTEIGKRTLLIDCDLRLSSIAEKLGLKQEPGLTELLVMNEKLSSVMQHYAHAPDLSVITAGSPPPNPSELLGSNAFRDVLKELAENFDYIIIDLPPVIAVTDALVAAKLLDGVIVVVRNGQVTRKELAETMRQLKLVDVRVLGFAYRDAKNNGKSYRSYAKSYKKND